MTFTMVDPAAVQEVGPAAAILHARIMWRAERDGRWRATRQLLADETGLSLSMLRTAVQVLREAGWITTERTSPDDPTLMWAPTCMVAESAPPLADLAPPPLSDPQSPPARSAITSIETVETTTETPPVVPPVDVSEPALFSPSSVVEKRNPAALAVVPDPDDVDAEFAEFWERYPRKVGKAKALLAFRKARRTTPLPVIAHGLVSQLPYLTSREKSYVPHATTWLNGQRWADRPEDLAAAAPSGRRNVFNDPALGGMGSGAVDVVSAFLGQPRALGARS